MIYSCEICCRLGFRVNGLPDYIHFWKRTSTDQLVSIFIDWLFVDTRGIMKNLTNQAETNYGQIRFLIPSVKYWNGFITLFNKQLTVSTYFKMASFSFETKARFLHTQWYTLSSREVAHENHSVHPLRRVAPPAKMFAQAQTQHGKNLLRTGGNVNCTSSHTA